MKFNINTLTINDIRQIYSGKPGCCCGCLGTHSYNEIHLKESSERRGYEISSATAKIATNRSLNRMLNLFKKNSDKIVVDITSNISFETNTRLYVIYFCKSYIESHS